MKDQLCPKCATGTCVYRDGIMCRGVVCQRDDESARAKAFGGLDDPFIKDFFGGIWGKRDGGL